MRKSVLLVLALVLFVGVESKKYNFANRKLRGMVDPINVLTGEILVILDNDVFVYKLYTEGKTYQLDLKRGTVPKNRFVEAFGIPRKNDLFEVLELRPLTKLAEL